MYEYAGAFARGYLYDILTGQDILPDFVDLAYRLTREAGGGEDGTIPDDIWEQATAAFPWPEDCPGDIL